MNARRALRSRSARRPDRERGLASVELALVTPALLIMMLIAGEFTRVFYQYNTLTKSVRDGARHAAEDAFSNLGFELTPARITEAQNLAATGSVTGTQPALLPDLLPGDFDVARVTRGAGGNVREHVQVTGTYEFQPLIPSLDGLGFLPGDVNFEFTLTATSTMRAL